jgi:hypothetical protein
MAGVTDKVQATCCTAAQDDATWQRASDLRMVRWVDGNGDRLGHD